MSTEDRIYAVDQANVDDLGKPVPVGPKLWAFDDGAQVTASNEDAITDEIGTLLDRVARLEAVRQHMLDVDTCLILDRVEELCQELYQVDLAAFSRNGGALHTKALYRMAHREIQREREAAA